MDSTEDLSARVLFKHILNIEPPRTPLTRSATAKSTSGSRRSSRLGKNDDGAQTPQSILRRSLKHKIRESISNKTLPTRRRTASTVLKNTPAPNSMLFDDGDTPRHILKNILLTEPVKSPVVNEQAESEDQQPQLLSPNSSLQSRRPSIELSGLELPDLTIGNFESTVKGLSRKRPRRSLNVTAFEKRLKERNDIVEEDEESLDDHSSLSLSSSTSLSLKTPFTDVRTEKKGLQRRGSNRRKVTEEEFCAAVNKRQIGNYHGVSSLAPEQGLSETTYSDFTLGVSKLSEPDITTDIVHCNTALYAQTDGIMSNDLTLATQDKPTVMASQIQRDMEEQLDAKQQPYSFPLEENTLMDAQDNSQFVSARSHLDIHEVPDEDAATTSKSEQEKSLANHTFDIDDQVDSDKEQKKEQSQAEEADSQTEGNAAEKACSQDQDAADIQTENEDQTDAQSSDDVAAESEKEESAVGQQSHQEAPFVSLRLEDEGRDSQTNDEHEAEGDKEEVEGNEDDMEEGEGDEEEDEDDIGEDKEEVEGSEDDMEEVEDDVEGDKEEVEGVEDDIEEVEGSEEGERLDNLEHISRRAPCTEGALIMPIQKTDGDLANNTKPGYSDTELKGDDTRELHNDMDLQNTEISQSNFDHMAESPTHKEKSDVEANLDANKENSFHENDVMHDDELPEHVELEEQSMDESEEEEEENEDIPSMMPAFVKQKRNFFYSHPQASPFVPKNIQPSDLSTGAPAAQPKQRAQRKPRSPKSDSSLPKSYLMNVFKHFAKTKVSADVYPVLKEIMDRFFDRLAKDLEAYALHAKRSTIEVADCELLLRRQGHVNDKVPVEVLIEKYLRMDQRKLLIPIATSGNVVFPKKR